MNLDGIIVDYYTIKNWDSGEEEDFFSYDEALQLLRQKRIDYPDYTFQLIALIDV